jgi:hypothetical protein
MVRITAHRLADALRAHGTEGAEGAAEVLRTAGALRTQPAEELLELRSALVLTRDAWSDLEDPALVRTGATVLSEAKRLAIDM